VIFFFSDVFFTSIELATWATSALEGHQHLLFLLVGIVNRFLLGLALAEDGAESLSLCYFGADHSALATLGLRCSGLDSVCLPVFRWAGGKRLLLPRLSRCLPPTFGRYFEPMVGAGALFFHLQPRRAFLGDLNPELMNFYYVLQRRPHDLYRAITRLRSSKRVYYALRILSPASRLARAARFFYLVRLSWNGLYRVNRLGRFNVPYGGRRPRNLVILPRLLAASDALQNAFLRTGDLLRTTRDARVGDLVYFDPPYPRGAQNGGGFDRYASRFFRLDDHRRLAEHAIRLARSGIHVLVTEAARKEILALYSRDFYVTLVRTKSLIAAKGGDRRQSYEAILTSYRPRR
jgi:DNA adenine methylase